MAIPVFYSFARSGGTLINKCLGCDPGNLILSEVNPAGAFKSIEEQAFEWLQLIEEGERRDLEQRSYGDKIGFLEQRARARGKVLIIRDWCSVNFLRPGRAAGDIVPPCSGVLEQSVYLRSAGLDPRAVVITREAASVFLSIKRAFRALADLELDEFARAYAGYAEAVRELPCFQLEKFRREPERDLQRICEALGVNHPANFLGEFSDFERCTGNNTLAEQALSQQAATILPEEGKRSAEWQNAAEHPLCRQANEWFGYDAAA